MSLLSLLVLLAAQRVQRLQRLQRLSPGQGRVQDSRETREVDGMYERGNGSGSSAARGSSLTLRASRTTSVASARLLQLTDSSGLRGPQGGWSTPALGYALRWPLFLSTSQKPLFDTPETPPLFSGSNHRTTARLLSALHASGRVLVCVACIVKRVAFGCV